MESRSLARITVCFCVLACALTVFSHRTCHLFCRVLGSALFCFFRTRLSVSLSRSLVVCCLVFYRLSSCLVAVTLSSCILSLLFALHRPSFIHSRLWCRVHGCTARVMRPLSSALCARARRCVIRLLRRADDASRSCLFFSVTLFVVSPFVSCSCCIALLSVVRPVFARRSRAPESTSTQLNYSLQFD